MNNFYFRNSSSSIKRYKTGVLHWFYNYHLTTKPQVIPALHGSSYESLEKPQHSSVPETQMGEEEGLDLPLQGPPFLTARCCPVLNLRETGGQEQKES